MPTQYYIDLKTEEGRISGLIMNSVVKGENIFTLPKSFIHKKIGLLPASSMKAIDKIIKISLALN